MGKVRAATKAIEGRTVSGICPASRQRTYWRTGGTSKSPSAPFVLLCIHSTQRKKAGVRSVSPATVGLSEERSDRLELSDLIRSRTSPPTLNFAQVDESQKKRQPLVSRFDLIDRTL